MDPNTRIAELEAENALLAELNHADVAHRVMVDVVNADGDEPHKLLPRLLVAHLGREVAITTDTLCCHGRLVAICLDDCGNVACELHSATYSYERSRPQSFPSICVGLDATVRLASLVASGSVPRVPLYVRPS